VRADTEVYCITLGRLNLIKILGDKVQIIIFNNLMRWRLLLLLISMKFRKEQLVKIINETVIRKDFIKC
jgi:cGMP-dependent protein kinase